MGKSTCCIHECGKPMFGKFLCNAHYSRLARTGTTALRPKKAGKCKVPKCGKPLKGQGYCTSHWRKFKLYGSPLVTMKKRGECSMDGCEKPHLARGYCVTHYHRDWKHGDPSGASLKYVWGEFTACVVCEAPIPEGFRLRRYCSNSCATAKSMGHDRPDDRPCAQCGSPIDFMERSESGRLRSRVTRLCEKCKPVSHMWRHIPYLRDRDGDACHLCGEVIDFDLKFPNPKSRSVDHVIPRSLGGPNDVSNYKLACFGCNAAKSNRILEPA